MIDVIIPTMWMASGITDNIQSYIDNRLIGKVIVIDNNKKARPKLPTHKKLEIVSYGSNIFVNPAWNEGVARATANIVAIINDDISVYPEIFEMVHAFKLESNDIIGVNLRGYQDNYKIDDYIDTEEKIVKINYDITKPIGGQAWAFGICMFMKREAYKVIPSLYQVWYGDDYLCQRATSVYAINTNKIKGKISETLKKFDDPNSDVSKRIELDSKNLIKCGHFTNGKHWDIPHNMIAGYKAKRRMKQNTIALEYEKAKTQKSDINENVHILYELAQECETVTEMGVRTGVSTRALLNSDAKITSYDIEWNSSVEKLFELARSEGKDAQYIQADVLKLEIEPTDMLFIDTLHTYGQLKQELKLHAKKAHKYLAFHDTQTFGLSGEIGNERKGLLTAIIEFLVENPEWKFKIYKTNNNGFTVLERMK